MICYKIEKPEAVQVIDEIIAAVDQDHGGARDLGIEVSPEAVPMMQKLIIAKCNNAGVPVITATQMLDLMIRNLRPTRARSQRRSQRDSGRHRRNHAFGRDRDREAKYPVRSVETMGAHCPGDRDHWSA